MRLRVLIAALVLTACACKPSPTPVPPPHLPPPLHPPTEASCDLAESRLRELDCRRDDGNPWASTPKGVPFAEACKVALRDGRIWNSHCIARITDCSMLMPAYRGEWCGVGDGGAQ